MRWLARLTSLALATLTWNASAAEIAFAYAHPNVGMATGGHAAFVAGDTAYHVQADGAGLFRIVRDGWDHFTYVYSTLQNRPLSIAHVAVTDRVREALLDRFARVYVEQDLDYARRDERALDLAWLEALRDGRPLPPLRAAGLLSPDRADDPDARTLAARLRERAGAGMPASSSVALSTSDPAALRDQLALREALRGLERAYGLDPEALATLPAGRDDPLTSEERAALGSLAAQLERDLVDLLFSDRPDRGYALLLFEARWLAIQRSLGEGRLRVLDPFAGRTPPPLAQISEASAAERARRLEYLDRTLRRVRRAVLASGRLDTASYNVLEEAAGVIQRAVRDAPGVELLEVARRQAPVRGRSVEFVPSELPSEARLAAARAELARAEARLRERWSYALLRRNCITELADVVVAAFASLDAADRALGGRIPAGEPLAAIPAVFFARVRERLREVRVEHRLAHRVRALEVLTERDPRAWTRVRESIAPLAHLYTPKLRDGAFLLFTDDVFWRRPLYGSANLAYGLGYAALGALASPLDGGRRWQAGIAGALWSLPELAFQNVRKGTFDFVEPDEPWTLHLEDGALTSPDTRIVRVAHT